MTSGAKSRLAIQRPIRDVASALLSAGAVLVVFATLVFLALRILPGDPTTMILGDESTHAERAELAVRLGFDLPLVVQYRKFIVGLGCLDLGASLAHPGRSAFSCVSLALKSTALLAFISVVLGALSGVGAALLCVGPWLGKRAALVHGGVLLVAAVPMLALAPFATWVFAVEFSVVPLPGDPDHPVAGLLFAATLLALPLGAQVARIGRVALLEQRHALFLHTAMAKGASPWRVWSVHALPVAAAPILVVVASQLGSLLGGAVVLERFFERPGLGTLMLEAYAARDFPVLEAAIVAAGLLFVLVQVTTTGLTALLDPRGQRS